MQQILRHKSVQNTRIHIQYEKTLYGTSANDEFTVKVTTNIEEACALAEVASNMSPESSMTAAKSSESENRSTKVS